jgi:4'-phosphopantetheinyl transferase
MPVPSPLLTTDPLRVDLWWLDAANPEADETALEAALDEAERADLARLRHPVVKRHRRYFRARQREILSRYTGLAPEAHRFVAGPHGKPDLTNAAGVAYNLSHSGDFGLLAVTGAPAIGVDLEDTRREVELLDLAERFFAPAESATLRALPPAARRPAFFHCWVRKEAWLKALGTGLSTPLDRFVVSLDPLRRSGWLEEAGPTGQAAAWTLLVPAPLPVPTCVAALAVRGAGVTLRWSGTEGVGAGGN